MTISAEQFADLASQGYNRIPVTREVFADLDTPLSTYLKLAREPYSYLFESVQGGEKWGRYSIIGLPSHTIIRVKDGQVTLQQGDQQQLINCPDPLTWIDEYQQRCRAPELAGLPRFSGGLVGYFSYDTVRYIEPRLSPCPHPDPLGTPDILLMVSDEVVVFDNLAAKLHMIVHVDPGSAPDTDLAQVWGQAQRRLDEIEQQLYQGLPADVMAAESVEATGPAAVVDENAFVSAFGREEFETAVTRIKDYIVDGDIMQAVLSQRLSIPYQARPLDLYRALRSLNPSPYMYFLDLDEFQIVGSSPEILTHLEDGVVTVRPIAGTRRRGQNELEDRALEQELLADPKELAEHLMLIDLGRNDVGRIAETGTVELTEKMVVERYSHVMHIVSNVRGQLQAGMNAMDALRATFPAGTVSGAPKIRAMEILDELEPVKRGIYSGAVGYIGWNGNMDTAIAIRTAVIKDGQLHIQVGAGIVADSVPASEWDETMSKGRAMFRAAEMVAQGLGRKAGK
jgi:anthranilate synthase component 1